MLNNKHYIISNSLHTFWDYPYSLQSFLILFLQKTIHSCYIYYRENFTMSELI